MVGSLIELALSWVCWFVTVVVVVFEGVVVVVLGRRSTCLALKVSPLQAKQCDISATVQR